MSTENKWIPVAKKLPPDRATVLICNGSHPFILAYVRASDRTWWDRDRAVYPPLYWQPLPEPPPKPDAFEEFCNAHKVEGVQKFIYLNGYYFHPATIRPVWDAAIESTKGEQ